MYTSNFLIHSLTLNRVIKNLFFRKRAFLPYFIFLAYFTHGQTIKNTSLDLTLGYAVVESFDFYENNDHSFGLGVHLQAEKVYELNDWINFRSYAGVVITKPFGESEGFNKTTINGLLAGGKVRLVFPIPWFAPYVEIGQGLSWGEFISYDDNYIEKK